MSKLRLWAVCAVKGGVGKTSIANAVAMAQAAAGGTAVVVEADFLGTTVSDAWAMRAPVRPVNQDGSLDLVSEAPLAYLSATETRAAVRDRAASPSGVRPHSVPYFNDIVLHGEPQDPQLASLLWKLDGVDSVGWLPISPIHQDALIAARWLQEPDPGPVVRRLLYVLRALRASSPTLTDVVLDLPPGLFGFSDILLAVSHRLGEDPGWDVRRLLVTTPDRQDIRAAARAWMELFPKVGPVTPVINRATENDRYRAVDFVQRTETGAAAVGFDRQLRRVGYQPTSIGSWFREPAPQAEADIRDLMR